MMLLVLTGCCCASLLLLLSASTKQVAVRAFGQAYAQARVKGTQAARAAATKQSGMSDEEKKADNARIEEEEEVVEKAKANTSMRIDEAWKVIGLEQTATPAEIRMRYNHLFNVTDKENGGSFYIQSKVFCAKEAIDIEVPPTEEEIRLDEEDAAAEAERKAEEEKQAAEDEKLAEEEAKKGGDGEGKGEGKK
jgi:import inner membrane translocase subunit TIM16